MYNRIPYGRNERNLFKYLDKMENDFWNADLAGMQQFRCDVQEGDDAYVLEADLPGFDKDDIKIDHDGSTLVITAKHPDVPVTEAEKAAAWKEHKEQDKEAIAETNAAIKECEADEKKALRRYVRRERKLGNYRRSFDLTGIDVDNISAAYNNGVLVLTLPKQSPKAPETRHIAIL
jgi:HSP20 family protein